MSDHKEDKQKNFLGYPVKFWTKIALFSVFAILLIFIVTPFVFATILPAISSEIEEYEPLVKALDGMAFVVGLVGTVASVLSIVMTIADRKRYQQEKEETQTLLKSVDGLHSEIKNVDDFVKKTYEQNQRLALELYECKIISSNPNLEVHVSTCESGAHERPWESGGAGEIDA